MKKESNRRNWMLNLLWRAFETNLDERDYQIVKGIYKYYNNVAGGTIKPDLMAINLAYQIGKAEANKTK